MRKCQANLDQGLRPLIITTENGMGGAIAHARDANLLERIDILEVEQFIATNVYEKSGFADAKRSTTVKELIQRYNNIIESCESDPSLKISMGD